VKQGSDVAIFALGNLFSMSAELAQRLESEGHSVALVNPRFIKPLDVKTLAGLARRVRALVTFEDHVLKGGFGSAVLEALNELGITVPVVRIGWPDQFIEHGKVDGLREKYGISVKAALEQLQPLLGQPIAVARRSSAF
jgi:1-deoxy-D-xylulose-5-phosphate synthase